MSGLTRQYHPMPHDNRSDAPDDVHKIPEHERVTTRQPGDSAQIPGGERSWIISQTPPPKKE